MQRVTGLYLEEFELGKCYPTAGRTVTEADVVNFAGISGDFNPLHMDEEFGKTTIFGKRIAHGALGVAMATGLSLQAGWFEGTNIAFLEFTARYNAPLCIGDTIHLEMVPTEIHYSKKPDRGVLKLDVALVNQKGETIQQMKWNLMMKRKPTE